jgi:hypothetical protein
MKQDFRLSHIDNHFHPLVVHSLLFSSRSLHHVLLFCILTPPGGVALNRLFFSLFCPMVVIQSVSLSLCILLSIREYNRWKGKKIAVFPSHSDIE